MPNGSPLQRLLDGALERRAQSVAVRCGPRTISYRELDRLVGAAAAGLNACGVEAGDRVAWWLPNCLEAVVTTLACYRIAAVAVPLNYRYAAPEAQDVLERTRAALLVFHRDRAGAVQQLLDAGVATTLLQVGAPEDGATPAFELVLSHEPLVDRADVEPDEPALILFTSGSTGRPKGVVHSHEGAFAGIDVSRRVFDFNERDVVLVGKPISHAGGLQTQLMPTLHVRGEVVLAMKPSPAEAVALITAHSVTQYGLLASDLLDFIEYLEANRTPLPTLKNSIGSGDSVPIDLHHRFRDLLGWEVMEGAGMTEIGGYYAVNPRYGTRKWGSLGLPTPLTDLRVVGDGVDCAPGEVGEILVRAPSATTGYWEDALASEELFRDGWLHTGDLGRRDVEGYLWFVARKKLIIVRRGSNIAPAEVENVLDEHPRVHASVVVGVRRARDGHIPVACVALLDTPNGTAEEELRGFVAGRLAAYKNPEHYLFLEELPRTSTGKFDRHKLEELAEERFGE